MKITREQLKTIIKEELAAMDEAGVPGEDPTVIMLDMQKALGALSAAGPDALNADNLETIQSLLDRLKDTVGPSEEDEEARRSLARRLNARDSARPRDDYRKHDYTRHSANRGQHNYAQSSRYGGGSNFAEGRDK